MEKILIIDDDEGLLHFLTRFFTRKEYQVEAFNSAQAALELITKESFDLILLDYKMPELNGLEALKQIKSTQVKTPVIIMTAYGTTETAIDAMKLGAYDYLVKPFDRKELSRIVNDAFLANRQMKEVVSFPNAATKISPISPKGDLQIIGNSKKMQEVYKLIGQIAEKDISILITGESGTGKELVAKAIYHHSHRKNNAFITINCAAIPDSLFESELFGYERGAFTGANHTHIGKIERCNGGTFFMDEVGDMSLNTQTKVLRVIQEGEFERLGGTELIKVDVRIIAATNKNLEKEVEAGRFREDLYWRLKIFSIQLPPLRNRLADIPSLVDYFVGRFCVEYSKTTIQYVSDAAIKKLMSHFWPGNVRELKNAIRRSVLLCSGDVLLEDHLIAIESTSNHISEDAQPEQLIKELKEKMENLIPEIFKISETNTHANIIEIVEEILISHALKMCDNNQVKAARILGISRNTLRHRMKKYNEK
jgi:DNA-binding NtrC family response regulator